LLGDGLDQSYGGRSVDIEWSAVQVMRVMQRANIPAVVAVAEDPDRWIETAE
jgi:hypothetical protein